VIDLKNDNDWITSREVNEVFFAVVRGKNYSTIMAGEFDYTQQAADKNLKKLVKIGLLTSRRDGQTVRYYIKWDKISQVWLTWVKKQRLRSLEKEEYRRLVGAAQSNFDDIKERIEKNIEGLKDDERMWKFAKNYMEAYEEMKRGDCWLEDAFGFFANEVLPCLKKSKIMKKTYPFYIELKTREDDNYSSGRAIANLLRKKIIWKQQGEEISAEELDAIVRDPSI